MIRPLTPIQSEAIALLQSRGVVAMPEFIRATRTTAAKAKQRIDRLVARGLVVRLASGGYALAERPVAA